MPRFPRSSLVAPLFAAAALAACGPGTATPAALAQRANYYLSPQARTSDFLGIGEISLSPDGSAYDVIRRLRPQYLTARRGVLPNDPLGGRPAVYLDGVRLGSIEELRSIPARSIAEMRYFSGLASSQQYGRYYDGGVIAIRSRP